MLLLVGHDTYKYTHVQELCYLRVCFVLYPPGIIILHYADSDALSKHNFIEAWLISPIRSSEVTAA